MTSEALYKLGKGLEVYVKRNSLYKSMFYLVIYLLIIL